MRGKQREALVSTGESKIIGQGTATLKTSSCCPTNQIISRAADVTRAGEGGQDRVTASAGRTERRKVSTGESK